MKKYLHIGGPLDGRFLEREDSAKGVMHMEEIKDLYSNTVEATEALEYASEGVSYSRWLYEKMRMSFHGPEGKITVDLFAYAGLKRTDVAAMVWSLMLEPVQQRDAS